MYFFEGEGGGSEGLSMKNRQPKQKRALHFIMISFVWVFNNEINVIILLGKNSNPPYDLANTSWNTLPLSYGRSVACLFHIIRFTIISVD